MEMNETPNVPLLDRSSILPFVAAGLGWVAIGALFCWKSSAPAELGASLRWMLGLSLLCLLDLLATAKTFANVLQKRSFSLIRASYWGAIKIACFLLFGALLWKAGSLPARVPVNGLIIGVSTLMIVPLIGGLIWNALRTRFVEETA
jgi:hypothetical protein